MRTTIDYWRRISLSGRALRQSCSGHYRRSIPKAAIHEAVFGEADNVSHNVRNWQGLRRAVKCRSSHSFRSHLFCMVSSCQRRPRRARRARYPDAGVEIVFRSARPRRARPSSPNASARNGKWLSQREPPIVRAGVPVERSRGSKTGSGLTISREIIRRDGGNIRITNQPGGGLVQIVEFPSIPACSQSFE